MLNKNMIIHGDARVGKKLVKLTHNHNKTKIPTKARIYKNDIKK